MCYTQTTQGCHGRMWYVSTHSASMYSVREVWRLQHDDHAWHFTAASFISLDLGVRSLSLGVMYYFTYNQHRVWQFCTSSSCLVPAGSTTHFCTKSASLPLLPSISNVAYSFERQLKFSTMWFHGPKQGHHDISFIPCIATFSERKLLGYFL